MHFGRETFLIRMEGHSMTPRFDHGDYLWVDLDERALPGRVIAITDPETGEPTARLMAEVDGRRVLRALCADWPEIVLDSDNEAMILGVVVFAGSGVRR